jgi:hypothetical protein
MIDRRSSSVTSMNHTSTEAAIGTLTTLTRAALATGVIGHYIFYLRSNYGFGGRECEKRAEPLFQELEGNFYRTPVLNMLRRTDPRLQPRINLYQ